MLESEMLPRRCAYFLEFKTRGNVILEIQSVILEKLVKWMHKDDASMVLQLLKLIIYLFKSSYCLAILHDCAA